VSIVFVSYCEFILPKQYKHSDILLLFGLIFRDVYNDKFETKCTPVNHISNAVMIPTNILSDKNIQNKKSEFLKEHFVVSFKLL
jgi:hypothetical protein